LSSEAVFQRVNDSLKLFIGTKPSKLIHIIDYCAENTMQLIYIFIETGDTMQLLEVGKKGKTLKLLFSASLSGAAEGPH